MSDLQDTSKAKTKEWSDKTPALSNEFRPLFWSGLDGRVSVVKETLRRYEKLRKDTGSDSVQKDLLCQRITFLAIRLESMEREAIESGMFDAGLYVSLTNALTGMLRLIGINRKAKITSLKDYVQSKTDMKKVKG